VGILSIQLEVFRYRFPPSVRRILHKLLKSLDGTDERVLKGQNGEPNMRRAHGILQCLVVAVRPLRVEELERAGETLG
jgi:hypothetical protein